MKKILNVCVVLITLISGAACQPVRTVKVTVIGDDTKPIEGAEVRIAIIGNQPDHDHRKIGLTDEAGVFEASGQPLLRMLVRVNKEGHYETVIDRLVKEKDHDITLVLREKKNPMPLYAKCWRIVTDVMDQKLGFDFEKGDWVQPFGNGENNDILFKVILNREDFFEI